MNSWEVVIFFSIYWWVTLLMSDIIESNNQGDLCLEWIILIVCISVLQNRTCCPSLTMSRLSTTSNLNNVLSLLIILKSAGLPLLSSSIIVTLVISPHVGTQSIHIKDIVYCPWGITLYLHYSDSFFPWGMQNQCHGLDAWVFNS